MSKFENIDPKSIIGASDNINKVVTGSGTWVEIPSASDLTTTYVDNADNNLQQQVNNEKLRIDKIIIDMSTTLDKNIKAIRVIKATRERVFYYGVGTINNPSIDGLKQALFESVSGDTVQQITDASLQGVGYNGQQALVKTGVNYNTNGFSLDSRNTGADGLTLTDGTGTINGMGSTVYHDAPYSWGLGITSSTMSFNYHINDLNIVSSYRGSGRKPECSVIFSMGTLLHTGNIKSTTNKPSIIVGIPAYTYTSEQNCYYEHTGSVIISNQTIGFQVAKIGMVMQKGDFLVQDISSSAGLLMQGGVFEMRNSVLDLSNTNNEGGFWIDSISTLILTSVTVLGQVPAIPMDLNQNYGGKVILRGSTSLPKNYTWHPLLNIIDERSKEFICDNDAPFTQINENQYGLHPLFSNQKDLNIWLLSNVSNNNLETITILDVKGDSITSNETITILDVKGDSITSNETITILDVKGDSITSNETITILDIYADDIINITNVINS